jgi:hypothetical protein
VGPHETLLRTRIEINVRKGKKVSASNISTLREEAA